MAEYSTIGDYRDPLPHLPLSTLPGEEPLPDLPDGGPLSETREEFVALPETPASYRPARVQHLRNVAEFLAMVEANPDVVNALGQGKQDGGGASVPQSA